MDEENQKIRQRLDNLRKQVEEASDYFRQDMPVTAGILLVQLSIDAAKLADHITDWKR